VRFLVDMPLSRNLAAWLRDNGHDAVHASEIGLHRAPDLDIITRARREGRTMITADLDYPRLLALARTAEPSLILFRDGEWSEDEVIARMSDILRALTEADIAQSIIVVDRERVRRRRLPIAGSKDTQ
jgi:predicted nuclease of predicted toxin-antitoxin system